MELKIKRINFWIGWLNLKNVWWSSSREVGRICSFSMKIENDEVCIFYTSILAAVRHRRSHMTSDDPFSYRDTNLILYYFVQIVSEIGDTYYIINRRFWIVGLILNKIKKKWLRKTGSNLNKLEKFNVNTQNCTVQ